MTDGPEARGNGLGACAQPLAQAYDAALCDLDGVLYLGEQGVPHAAQAVAAARAGGMRFAYVTNNASRPPSAVAERLTGLDIPAAAHDVVTSAQAAARLLAARAPQGAPVLVLGTEALAQEVADVGLRPVRTLAEAGADGPVAVVQGLAPTTSMADLVEATVAIRGGALWIAGNTDASLPSPRGPLPGNGSFVDVLRAVTGATPVVAGKPEPALHEASVERVGSRRPLVIGDRLDTDILGAVRAGADSLLVLTGVSDLDALLQAPRGSRPTYVAADLRGLLQAHPQVEVEGEGARCGASSARAEGGVLTVDGSGDDAVRALVSLGWRLRDAGVAVVRADA